MKTPSWLLICFSPLPLISFGFFLPVFSLPSFLLAFTGFSAFRDIFRIFYSRSPLFSSPPPPFRFLLYYISPLSKHVFFHFFSFSLKGLCHQIRIVWKRYSFKGLGYNRRRLKIKFFKKSFFYFLTGSLSSYAEAHKALKFSSVFRMQIEAAHNAL